MKVYLCEKPSQGEDVAKFLGMTSAHKKQGYYQKDDVAVTWARGHLFKLQPPEFYSPELKGRWSIDKLPVIPDEFKYILDVKSKPQFKVIKTLFKSATVVYIATDPDAEGECIARNIIKFGLYKGEVKRILYGATDKKTLTKAFAAPLDAEETAWMYYSAQARAQADWVVGMNLTMAMTLVVQKLESSGGLKRAFPVGRVKTPAAMLVYLREEAIKAFKPVNYYDVEVDLYTQSGAVFTVQLEWPERVLKDGRMLDKAFAQKAADYLTSQKMGIIDSLESVEKSKQPPLPYELTSLQSACDKYEISPDETLEIAQSLYDKPFSATTYPRTDTPYLTSGLADDIPETVNNLLNFENFKVLSPRLDLARRTKAWDDNKVKVHYGIIPTVNALDVSRLTPKQKAVYLLIAKRYLVQFLPDYVYENTNLSVKVGNLLCKATCNIPKSLGWREIEQDDVDDENKSEAELPPMQLHQKLGVKAVRVIEKTTRKPARYTQSSLAKAMVNIASEVSDPALKKLLNDKDGIGTVATRPAIIKDLIKSGLLLEEKRQLKPSRWLEKYISHIPKQLKEPGNSALWERGFQAIKSGQITTKQFVDFQVKFVTGAVSELRHIFTEIK